MKRNTSESFYDHEPMVEGSPSHVASEGSFFTSTVQANGNSIYPNALDPDALYNAIVYNHQEPLSAKIAEHFEVLALPGEVLTATPQEGDVLLRVALGEPGLGHVAVLSESSLWPHTQLANAPFDSESQQLGFYATVIEGGAIPHTRSDAFARRVLDSEGRMLPGQILLRVIPDGGIGAFDKQKEHIEFDEDGWLEKETIKEGVLTQFEVDLRQDIESALRDWESATQLGISDFKDKFLYNKIKKKSKESRLNYFESILSQASFFISFFPGGSVIKGLNIGLKVMTFGLKNIKKLYEDQKKKDGEISDLDLFGDLMREYIETGTNNLIIQAENIAKRISNRTTVPPLTLNEGLAMFLLSTFPRKFISKKIIEKNIKGKIKKEEKWILNKTLIRRKAFSQSILSYKWFHKIENQERNPFKFSRNGSLVMWIKKGSINRLARVKPHPNIEFVHFIEWVPSEAKRLVISIQKSITPAPAIINGPIAPNRTLVWKCTGASATRCKFRGTNIDVILYAPYWLNSIDGIFEIDHTHVGGIIPWIVSS